MAISGGDAVLGRASILLGAEVDSNFGRNAEKGILAPLQGIATKATAILAGAFVARKLFDFFKESAKAAAEDEKSVTLLTHALDAMDVTLADQTAAEKWIQTMSRARGVMDDELRPALAQAMRFTEDLTKAENLLGLAQDISVARGLPLINVVTALGKAYGGNITALARLGLAVKDSEQNVLSGKAAFDKLFDTMGGAGVAAMGTAEGRARALNVAWQEMKEDVGNLLLPVLSRVAQILTDDVIPPIRSVIGFLGTLNGLTDGWGGKVLATVVALGTLSFAFQKLVAIGGALKLSLVTTAEQLGQGAAIAASYAGGIVGATGATAASTAATAASIPVKEAAAVAAAELALTDATLAVQSALAAAAIGAEQLSLFGEAAALGTVQLAMFPTTVATEALAVAQGEAALAASALARAQLAQAAAARTATLANAGAKTSLLGAVLPIAAVAAAGFGLGYVLNKVFGDTSHSVKQLTKDLQVLSVEANAAKLQKFVDGINNSNFAMWSLHKDGFELLHKDFEQILKDTPQFAQQFLNVAASLKGGKEGTKGWQAEIDKTAAAIKKANQAGADWQAQIDGTNGVIDEETSALADLVNQTGEQAIAWANAAGFSDAFHESMDRGTKANEEYAKGLQDHADAYAGLVDAIGPYAAAIADTGDLTTEQLQTMAEDANQFASDFAQALKDAADPLSFFGDQTVITASQLQGFLEQSLAATQGWAANLQFAVAIGLDKGYIQELANAGPKSAPLLQALLDLVTQTSVSATNKLLTGVADAQAISRNLWTGFVADGAAAARRLAIEVQDVLTQMHGATAAITTVAGLPAPPPPPKFPTLESVGVPSIGGGSGASAASTAIKDAADAVADSIRRLQDQFKIGEITEQQLADQAGSMWQQTEKFSSSWMAIWDILNANAQHIQDASDKAGKAAQDAADTAAKAAQEAADKATKAAADAAEKIAAAAAKAAAEYADAFDEIVAVLGKWGAAVLKARGLSTDQLKAMASDLRSFQNAVASSFASAASAVAAFGNDLEVTGEQLLEFQRKSLEDARNWSQNITLLMQYGLDQALLRPLAEAGPKAAGLVKAYLDEIGLVGVDAVNQIARDQAKVLADTTSSLLGGFTNTGGFQGSSQTPPQINSTFTVQGSVYGVADLNAYMDQRDAALAAALGAGQR